MATLTATAISRSGVDIAGASADVAGDEVANTGKEIVLIKNGSGGSITVTLDIEATVDSAAAVDPTVTIADGITKAIGPFPTGIYNNSSTGRVSWTYSAVTSVTVKVLQLTPSN